MSAARLSVRKTYNWHYIHVKRTVCGKWPFPTARWPKIDQIYGVSESLASSLLYIDVDLHHTARMRVLGSADGIRVHALKAVRSMLKTRPGKWFPTFSATTISQSSLIIMSLSRPAAFIFRLISWTLKRERWGEMSITNSSWNKYQVY